MIESLDHIGVAVNNLDAALTIYHNILGLKLEKIETVTDQKVKVAVLKVGETKIELLEPTEKASPIANFLEKRGEGIHHIALRVKGIEDALQELKAKGIVLIDEKPRTGVENKKIAFLHPKSLRNVLLELCENPGTL
jgi:methylmalonyl-CoA/ethylmalonyl-CoA epimerase